MIGLWQFWLKLAEWFWRRRFLNILNRNLLFRYYLPLEKSMGLHLNKLESPPPKDAYVPSFQVWVLEKKSKIGKVYRQTDGQTDGRTDKRRTTGDQKSSLELSAQVS